MSCFKKLLLAGLIFINLTTYAQEGIDLDNEVRFSTYEEYSTKVVSPSIEFHLTVVNNSLHQIPDLGVTNRSKHVNFIINGEKSNPVSLYNGLEVTGGSKMIEVGDSATYMISWVLSEDSGILTHYGNIFTIQWQYYDLFTDLVEVNIEKRQITRL